MPTNVTTENSDDARKYQGSARQVFYEPRINPQAHVIPLQHFTQEYTGVSFIFSQGRRRMKIHRLVNELNLDWIFNYIKRGKIDNMV